MHSDLLYCLLQSTVLMWCRGVICLLKVVDGTLTKGDRVIASSTGEMYDVLEVCSQIVLMLHVYFSVGTQAHQNILHWPCIH